MAIDSPQAVRFCNEYARSIADRFAQLYFLCKVAGLELTAIGGSATIPNTTDPVLDGAQTDGRPIITGAKVLSLMNRAADLVIDLEANGGVKLGQIMAIAVNPGS